jgi:MSHA pilin protein MshD
MSPTTERRRERGVTLVELIVFIVIVSTAVAGVLMALDISNRSSADPMIQKQALAVAEALLEEVQLQPFTYCDPDDPQAATADSAAVGPSGCSSAVAVEGMGTETVSPYGPETRASATNPFDNVNDYNGFCMGPACASPTVITDLSGTSIDGLASYTASVAVATQALGAVPASDSLVITVTVIGPANTTVVLQGYRVRYAPNALP